MSVMSNKQIKSKSNQSFNESSMNKNKNSFNKTVNNNNNYYFNSKEYYDEKVKKYEDVNRIGIYDRVGEIITCQAIFTHQEKIVGKEKMLVQLLINVTEKGILIADHIHVDMSEYTECLYNLTDRVQITGIVYEYGNDKRGIKLIDPPIWLSDKLKTNERSELYNVYSMDKCNRKLNSYGKEELVNLIQYYKIKLNKLTESCFGRDTVFNYALTQITLNRNNTFIYEDKLYKFNKPILYYIVLLLSAIIYDLTTLMDNKRNKISEDYEYATISIFSLFTNICLYCNYLQGINGYKNNTVNSQGFTFICKQLDINPKKAYTHTVKHRYTNFELGDSEVDMFKESKPFYVIGDNIF